MWVHRLPVHIVPEEVANLTQSSVKLVYSAGTMRRPQASFEAQPRAARLLAPKMGIVPYTDCACLALLCKNQAFLIDRSIPEKLFLYKPCAACYHEITIKHRVFRAGCDSRPAVMSFQSPRAQAEPV